MYFVDVVIVDDNDGLSSVLILKGDNYRWHIKTIHEFVAPIFI